MEREAGTLRSFAIEGQTFAAPALDPALYVVATPIGNLGDVTLRALRVLAAADRIACEDTRTTRTLTERYAIRTPLTPYHEHNAAEARPRVLAALADGRSVALVSDAGTPLVSDPGYKLVRAALEDGHRVIPIPGASAPLAALTAAGLPTDAFFFAGFLPPKSGARRNRLAGLAAIPATLVFFEAPTRLAPALADMADVLGAARPATVARELTKLHEEVRRGTLAALADAFAASPPRGEIVVLVGPPEAPEATGEDVDALLAAALASLSAGQAASDVARLTGLPRREIYARALAMRAAAEEGEPE